MLATTTLIAGWALSGCGGTSDPTGTPTSSPTGTPMTSETAAARPTPTATPSPLSQFEDRAPVQTIRAMFEAQARAVNARNLHLPQLAATVTSAGQHLLGPAVRSDFGLRYPGPIPFTPTKVDVGSRAATVLGCMVGHGFAVDPATGKPAGKRKVYAVKIALVNAAQTWKVDSLYLDRSTSCRGVTVPEVTW